MRPKKLVFEYYYPLLWPTRADTETGTKNHQLALQKLHSQTINVTINVPAGSESEIIAVDCQLLVTVTKKIPKVILKEIVRAASGSRGVLPYIFYSRLGQPDFIKILVEVDTLIASDFLKRQFTDSEGKLVEISKTELNRIFTEDVHAELKYQIELLFFACNIALPGSLSPIEGVCMVNKGEYKFSLEDFINPTRETLEDIKGADTLGWPIFNQVDIWDVWNWLSRQNNFQIFSTAVTDIERATCFLSNHFRKEKAADDLGILWSVAGLEAIYCKSAEGLSTQLREKSIIFLGRSDNLELITKRIKEMYEQRSKLVHGRSKLPISFGGHSDQDFDLKPYYSANLAFNMLLATIQKCALNNLSQLSFRYELDISNR